MSAELQAPVILCKQFNAYNITYIIRRSNSDNVNVTQNNAFHLMMKSANEVAFPSKIESAKKNSDKLINSLISYFEKNGLGWPRSIVQSTGLPFIKSLSTLLWHITCHFDHFECRAAKIPAIFNLYRDLNDYQAKKEAKPSLSKEKLMTYVETLSNYLVQPWLNKKNFKNFKIDLSILVESVKKVADQLEKNNEAKKNAHRSTVEWRPSGDNTETHIIPTCLSPVHSNYSDLSEMAEKMHLYQPLLLSDFEPEQRYERRHWLDKLQLPFEVAVMKRVYGGHIGNMNILWKVDTSNEDHETKMAQVILKVTEELPKYHTRQMKKDFVTKHQKLAKVSKANLGEMYRALTGDNTAAAAAWEQKQRERIAEFLSSYDGDDVITDLRSLNGKPNSSKYDAFWDEVHQLFSEYEGSVHERRQGSYLYLPFAISVRELIDRIHTRKPDIPVPSEEWVRLQFVPQNPYARTSLHYTGRFPIKFQVQRRQMRAQHEDAKYVFHQQRYFKEFAAKFSEHCTFVSSDDKALVPVGEPDHAITTGVRAHNASLGPSDPNGPVLAALDHDWKIAGVVTSVNFFAEIPDAGTSSFFNGLATASLKDRIFEKSSPMRHATELSKQVLEIQGGIQELNKEILLLVTDGGGDHNVTHASVKISLISLFLHLDTDMLVAMRTCPTQSWTNVAERVMSVLNLALQNVSTEREKMEPQFEEMLKRNNTMTKLRDAAAEEPSLKDAFEQCMTPVKKLLADRFEHMKIKEHYIKSFHAATAEEIGHYFGIIHRMIDPSIEIECINDAALSKSEAYVNFVQKHCLSTTYTFQIKKCTDEECKTCSLQPVRLPADVFGALHFIPAPTLDLTKQHYNKFADVFGTKPTEKDKPSLKFALESIEEDKTNKATLVAQKVRGVINCTACCRPRCVFANTKLNSDLKNALFEINEDNEYACGGSLLPDDDPRRYMLIVRRELACHMPMEVVYYSAKSANLPPVCFHCGGVSCAPLADDESIHELNKKHTVVRPICTFCKDSGKKPVTRGTKFSKK